MTIYSKSILYVKSNIISIVLVIVASLITLFWIVGAAYYHLEDSAGRGGAIAIAISFGWLFIAGNLGSWVKSELEELPDPNAELKARIGEISTNLAVVRHHNWYLVVSSVIGTLGWGFGDLVAKYLMPAWLVSKFELLVPLVVFLSCGLLPPAPQPSLPDNALSQAELSDWEGRWKNLSDQIEALRANHDGIQRPLGEISQTLKGIGASVEGVQKGLEQAIVAEKQVTTQEPPPPLPPEKTYFVSFDLGRVELNQAARQIISRVVAEMAKSAEEVVCTGYLDTSGGSAVNKRLSIQRLGRVVTELRGDGVKAKITIEDGDLQQAGRFVGITIR